MTEEKSYWVVSPNVQAHEHTVGEWRNCSVAHGMAFMGWAPDEWGHGAMGPKFAGKTKRGIAPGDVILIARRRNRMPQIVGFGEVVGEAETDTDFELPEEWSGSLRHLQPFISWSHPPADVPISSVVQHTKALIRLHPDWKTEHHQVCKWMDAHLTSATRQRPARESAPNRPERLGTDAIARTVKIVSSPNNSQLDYIIRTKAAASTAQRREAELLEAYRLWLRTRGRTLKSAKYNQLQCDGIEVLEDESGRVNLIEAKCSASREHIRMAVGQLLDYGFQGRQEYLEPRMAILLPESPAADVVTWLEFINIKVIWRSGEVFLDNDNGGFI